MAGGAGSAVRRHFRQVALVLQSTGAAPSKQCREPAPARVRHGTTAPVFPVAWPLDSQATGLSALKSQTSAPMRGLGMNSRITSPSSNVGQWLGLGGMGRQRRADRGRRAGTPLAAARTRSCALPDWMRTVFRASAAAQSFTGMRAQAYALPGRMGPRVLDGPDLVDDMPHRARCELDTPARFCEAVPSR